LAARVLQAAVRGYQVLLSPLFAGSCRYVPSCSQYMVEALARHGALRGSWLGLRRLARCHPLGSSGFDPVPDSPSRLTE
jgi:putative membrane protein insertion efficiency factor